MCLCGVNRKGAATLGSSEIVQKNQGNVEGKGPHKFVPTEKKEGGGTGGLYNLKDGKGCIRKKEIRGGKGEKRWGEIL